MRTSEELRESQADLSLGLGLMEWETLLDFSMGFDEYALRAREGGA
jgi:hypothetical protein